MIPCKHYQTSLSFLWYTSSEPVLGLNLLNWKTIHTVIFLQIPPNAIYKHKCSKNSPFFSHTESWKQKHALLRVNFYSFIKDILEWNWLFHLFCECMAGRKNFWVYLVLLTWIFLSSQKFLSTTIIWQFTVGKIK